MATLTQISQALNDLLPKLKPLSMPTGMLGGVSAILCKFDFSHQSLVSQDIG